MPIRYTGRVLTILAVLYVALVAIYPRAPFSIVLPIQDQPMTLKNNLRPGIDMVGGTSLVYEIQAAEGGQAGARGNLAQEVAKTLKRRVDPSGVRNLIWRPQGDTRLEIQMPLTGDSKTAEAVRAKYLAAQQQLDGFNVAPAQVVRLAENLTGEERTKQLDALAGESASRRAIFEAVAETFDATKQAEAGGSIPAVEAATRAYSAARADVAKTNLPLDRVQTALTAKGDVKDQQLQTLRTDAADFPARLAALNDYVTAFDAYDNVKGAISDTASLKRLLRGSGVLEFHILADDLSPDEYQTWYDRLMTSGPRPKAGDAFRWYPLEKADSGRGYRTAVGRDGITYALLYVTDDKTLDERDPDWGLARASLSADANGARAVAFEFNAAGARLFGDLTGQNLKRPLVVVLDDQVISVATIQARISQNGILTSGGGYSEAAASYLINTLNAGALPARLSDDPISERTVGPQLGEDNLRAGLTSCLVGIIALCVFMIGYYYLAGVVASVAVILNVVIILGAMAALNATFTLPGIAGIILSLGMSVDANVLIYERLREEQQRGLSLRMALRNAYDRAFSAIVDSNITTGITAFILYVFGSEEVAGFGLTLLIGIFASMFTALFVTKTIFGLMVDKGGLSDLGSIPRSFPKWDKLLNPDIDWIGKAGLFGSISAAIIVVGLVLFGWALRRGNVLDIEFAGGTTAQVELKQGTPIEDVRKLVDTNTGPLAGAQVVSIEPPANQPPDTSYEIVVPNADSKAVTQAVVARMGERLNLQQASEFADSGKEFAAVFGTDVLPIEDGQDDVAGLPVNKDQLAANVGGVAVVLRDMTPMLPGDEIVNRFNQQRLKGAYDAEGLRGGVRAEVATFPEQNAAVLLVSNDRYVYDAADPAVVDQWKADFAGPAWQLTSDAVARPAELSRVTTIGKQVAGEFTRDAFLGVFLSFIAIMAYVWIRFGDLKYGGATVIALVHDASFCVAGIGYAHFLVWAVPGLANLLLLDPFRLNLTMVASILTVMGFSMNDTVVVFDRIRENRGRYGQLSRGVINSAINQTLSRTILTSVTLILVLLFMYVSGGVGIHGFAFAMLIGMVTGTYSSIAIAAPLLLIGIKREQDVPAARAATA